jgi:hypothetical protein
MFVMCQYWYKGVRGVNWLKVDKDFVAEGFDGLFFRLRRVKTKEEIKYKLQAKKYNSITFVDIGYEFFAETSDVDKSVDSRLWNNSDDVFDKMEDILYKLGHIMGVQVTSRGSYCHSNNIENIN